MDDELRGEGEDREREGYRRLERVVDHRHDRQRGEAAERHERGRNHEPRVQDKCAGDGVGRSNPGAAPLLVRVCAGA
jgi:hypothetical protein